MTENNSESKYKLGTLDLKNPRNAHDFQIILTGTGKKVLEFGPASGYISRILKDRGCNVTGIESNPDLAEQAKAYLDKIIVGDVEQLDLDQALGSEKFDVILMADFLEHLKEPANLLKKLPKFLKHEGYIVCSIPNIAHATIRLKLLDGEFTYEPIGLLDDTHLRFFTLDTILSMLDNSGYTMIELFRVKEDIVLSTRTDLNPQTIPEELMNAIMSDPEATTYQYVFKAVPTHMGKSYDLKWQTDFTKNIVTRKLKEIIDRYKIPIKDLEKSIQDRDVKIATLQQLLDTYQKRYEEIQKSFTWKMLRRYDRIIRKLKGTS